MDFEFSDEQKAFAEEVEKFLDANDDPEVFDVTRENMAQIVDTPPRRGFMKKLADKGWLGITWPKFDSLDAAAWQVVDEYFETFEDFDEESLDGTDGSGG